MKPARLALTEAAEVLGISPTRVTALAAKRGWIVASDNTVARENVDAERMARRENNEPLKLDTFSKAGAEKLAETIREHWRRRGHDVDVRVEPVAEYFGKLRTATWFVVRSDLVNGMPRK